MTLTTNDINFENDKHDKESRTTSATRSQGQQTLQGVKDNKHDKESRTTSTKRSQGQQARQGQQGVKDK